MRRSGVGLSSEAWVSPWPRSATAPASPAPATDTIPPEVTDRHRRRPRWYVEALVIVWLCWIYNAIRSLHPKQEAAAEAHARGVFHLEQILHLDPEPSLNHWLAAHPTLGFWAATYYDNAHFVVPVAIIGWLWWRHPGPYRRLRTSLILINVLAFVVFWYYPVAPPRLLPASHFVDVVANSHAFGAWHSGVLAATANDFAAMPSLHIAWAAWSSLAGWRIFRAQRWAPLVWLYPVITTAVVLATANHYLLDVAAGLLTIVIATSALDAGHMWKERHQARGRHRPDSTRGPANAPACSKL